MEASITSRGAILLGKYTACDAFDERRPLRVVTHAHHDHILGLHQSLKKCEAVIMTPATRDLINVVSKKLPSGDKIKALDYGQKFEYGDERLTLHYADHILGSAQVLVEDEDGSRFLYTSDFRFERTPVIEADILVIEATYGSPWRTRPFKDNVRDALVSLIKRFLRQGPVYIFGYHGKIQEAMQILHDAGVQVPFIVPEKVFQVSRICERYGMRLGNYLLSTGEDACSIVERGEPYVAFYHMSSRRYVGRDMFRIYLSGWEFNSACRKISEKEFVIALSDHSDFNGLLKYVEKSKPKLVITDNYRVGGAEVLAEYIRKKLGIPARPLPSKWV